MSRPNPATLKAPDGAISVLTSALVDRIAAGEVVERPASVVKELVENAVDAGATFVQVAIEQGGLDRITVSDDGMGMGRADAELAVVRHATSKLRTDEDLAAIRTLGFRGEALAAIASVSRLTLTTRRRDDPIGTRVAVAGGETPVVTEAGCVAGTTVDVCGLFFNTPARRKFMRSAPTEQAHLVEAVLRVALGVSGLGVVVSCGERRLVDLNESATERVRWQQALGARASTLLPFAHTSGPLRIEGLLGPPESSRTDARGLWVFVNGRFVRDRMLHRAIVDGYRGWLERGRTPVAGIYLELPPEQVDVNVHPQKLEVRFRDSSAVFRALSQAVTSGLADAPRSLALPGVHGGGANEPVRVTRGMGAPSTASLRLVSARDELPAWDAPPSAERHSVVQATSGGGEAHVVQVLGERWVVALQVDALVVVDAWAARTRTLAERLRSELAAGAVARRPLLFPEIVELDTALSALVDGGGEELARLGLEIEPVGPGRYAVRSAPAAVDTGATSQLVHAFLGALAEQAATRGGGTGGADAVTEAIDLLAQVAGRFAPAGAELEWAQALVGDLERSGALARDGLGSGVARRLDADALTALLARR